MRIPTALDVLMLVPLILSLTVHEFAHAWSAWKLGDDTAARQDRLTLNPLSHIDVIGTIIFPLLSPLPFGWAKPVPIDPVRFSRRFTMRTGVVLTAAAGPASNVILAALCTLLYGLLGRFDPGLLEGPNGPAVEALLLRSIVLNFSLALFNMIPVPPLDGSRVVDGLLSVRSRFRATWDSFLQYSTFGFIAVVLFGGYLIERPLGVAVGWAFSVIRVIVSS